KTHLALNPKCWPAVVAALLIVWANGASRYAVSTPIQEGWAFPLSKSVSGHDHGKCKVAHMDRSMSACLVSNTNLYKGCCAAAQLACAADLRHMTRCGKPLAWAMG